MSYTYPNQRTASQPPAPPPCMRQIPSNHAVLKCMSTAVSTVLYMSDVPNRPNSVLDYSDHVQQF
jgi:hypothetical protein